MCFIGFTYVIKIFRPLLFFLLSFCHLYLRLPGAIIRAVSGQSPLKVLIPELLYQHFLPVCLLPHNIRKRHSIESIGLHHSIKGHILQNDLIPRL